MLPFKACFKGPEEQKERSIKGPVHQETRDPKQPNL